VVGVGVRGLKLDRAPEMRDGLVVLIALRPDRAGVVVRFGVPGPVGDDLVVAREGAVEVTVEMALHRRVESVDSRVSGLCSGGLAGAHGLPWSTGRNDSPGKPGKNCPPARSAGCRGGQSSAFAGSGW